jgi:two-component system sensor histidine kinase/response regulator
VVQVRPTPALAQTTATPTWDELPVPVWSVADDGGVVALNEGAMALVGSSGEGALAAWQAAIVATDQPMLSAARARARRQRSGYTVEYRVRRADGAERWLMETARPRPGGGFVCCGVDVTERRALERGLSSSSEFLNSLISAIPSPLFVLDEEGALIVSNDAYCAFVGKARGEVVGQLQRELFVPEVADRFAAQDHEAFASGLPHESEHAAVEAGGRVRWYGIRRHALSFPGMGRVLVGLITDITAHKETEGRLVTAHQAALAGLQSKSQFLATMSHEIRTPLNGVLGTLSLALEEVRDDSREYLEIAHQSASNLLNVLNDILDLSKIESGNVELEDEPFSPGDVLYEVVRLYSTQAHTKGLSLRAEVHAGLPTVVEADSLRLRQIVVHLVGNAVKFTPHGGIVVRALPGEASELYIEVEDTGIGIAREQHERIFEPFTQEDATSTRRFGGNGIGLAICRELAVLMGGGITVQSEVGKGSTFRLRLPVRTVVLGDALAGETSGGRALRVLVAEDDAAQRVAACRMLGALGHRVEHAATGLEAIAALDRSQFDVVFMDLDLPGVDGLEATRSIRESERRRGARPTPIVAVAPPEVVDEPLGAFGVDHVVAAPLSAGGLGDALRMLGQQHPSWSP